jgi:small-conductance mechanosensitive channel
MEEFFVHWGPASPAFWVRALWAFAFFILLTWLGSVLRGIAQRSLQRARILPNAIILVGRFVQIGAIAFAAVAALATLGIELSALAASAGLITVALTVAFQDLVRSFISGIYLLIEKTFVVGDTVQVADVQGIIEDVGIRTTILRDADGNRVVVPNGVLFNSIVKQKRTSKEQI